jgi:hypothetical protein
VGRETPEAENELKNSLQMAYFRDMLQTLEKRVEKLEKQVAKLRGRAHGAARKKDPTRTFGIFRNDPEFEKAVQLGRKYRRQQTYQKEIADS